MDTYFRELHELRSAEEQPSPEQERDLMRRHGMDPPDSPFHHFIGHEPEQSFPQPHPAMVSVPAPPALLIRPQRSLCVHPWIREEDARAHGHAVA